MKHECWPEIYIKSYKGITCFVTKCFPLGSITHTSNICITISFAQSTQSSQINNCFQQSDNNKDKRGENGS